MHVFALLTFAVYAAFQSSLVAFAILFQAVWLFTVTAFEMKVEFYLLCEGVGIAIQQSIYRSISLFIVNRRVMASKTVAALACFVHSEAITVKFKAQSFFTVAMRFFLGACLFTVFHSALWFWGFFILSWPILDYVTQILRKLFDILLQLAQRRWEGKLLVQRRVVKGRLFSIFVFFTLGPTGITVRLFRFTPKYNFTIYCVGVLNPHESGRLFDDWSRYLLYLAGKSIIWAKDVEVGIIIFRWDGQGR